MHESEKNNPYKGVLSSVQRFLGFVVDTPSNGDTESVGSWGATALVLLSLPAFFTAMCVCVVLLAVAFGLVRKESLANVKALLDWPVITLNLALAGLGLALHLLRKKNDREAFKEIAAVLRDANVAGMLSKSSSQSVFSNVLAKVAGSTATPARSEDEKKKQESER